MKKTILISILFLLCSATFAQQKVTLPAGTPETFVSHAGYDVSFNPEMRIPNYVAYRLSPSDITTEGVSRDGEGFTADPDIPGCPETVEYNRRNFPKDFASDRGHMMPAADCKTSETRMSESFYLSNVCPQDHTLNEKDWCDLEKQVRFWCKHYYKSDVWVVCGPVFGKDKSATGINIPSKFWKVVCRYDSRYSQWKAIGFIFENAPDSQPYAGQAVSVDEVEALTGMNFFSEVGNSENEMEKNVGGWKF